MRFEEHCLLGPNTNRDAIVSSVVQRNREFARLFLEFFSRKSFEFVHNLHGGFVRDQNKMAGYEEHDRLLQCWCCKKVQFFLNGGLSKTIFPFSS